MGEVSGAIPKSTLKFSKTIQARIHLSISCELTEKLVVSDRSGLVKNLVDF